jgi:hypothetical protein
MGPVRACTRRRLCVYVCVGPPCFGVHVRVDACLSVCAHAHERTTAVRERYSIVMQCAVRSMQYAVCRTQYVVHCAQYAVGGEYIPLLYMLHATFIRHQASSIRCAYAQAHTYAVAQGSPWCARRLRAHTRALALALASVHTPCAHGHLQ